MSRSLGATLAARVLAGEKRAVARAITLLESTRSDHRVEADTLVSAITTHAGRSLRLGISGAPGVGKSTFIEAIGVFLADRGHRVAVLAIDPSSKVNRGAILGDKTRMDQLSVHPNAYVRPSASLGLAGGIAKRTREAMLVLEAAGYEMILVETVGVGQSESDVVDLVDLFVLLQLPHAGDSLQAMKKGSMELADIIVVNKTDLDEEAARVTQTEIRAALELGIPTSAAASWSPPVLCSSALTREWIEDFWQTVESFRRISAENHEFERRRTSQRVAWFWQLIRNEMESEFRTHSRVEPLLETTLEDVRAGRVSSSEAANALLSLFRRT